MDEKLRYISVQHFGQKRVLVEGEDYRLGVVGRGQVRQTGVDGKEDWRPAERDPLQADWKEQYSVTERTPRSPDAGLSSSEASQPEPVQGVLREESPVSP